MGSVRSLPTDFPSLGAPWLLSGLAALAGRAKLAERLPTLINVLISNVPGPQFPLYFAGAKLATYYPVSIPAHGSALNMTVQSYNGALEFGLTACRRTVPDITDLADYVVEEHHKLYTQVVGEAQVQAQAPKAAAAATPVVRKSSPRRKTATAPPAKKAARPRAASQRAA